MRRISLLGMMLLVILGALVSALFARLGGGAFLFVPGPLLGAMFAALVYRRDRTALITGGAVGGLCQGIFTTLVLKRAPIFPDRGMMTGGLFLANLAVHLLVGFVFGTLLYLAFRWTRPGPTP